MDRTHYEILNISPSFLDAQRDPSPAIKRAYHRALLHHHPDKSQQAKLQAHADADAAAAASRRTPLHPTTTTVAADAIPAITIDRISEAYRALSDPATRAAYDLDLRLRRREAHQAGQREDFQTGIETLDLDDLDCDEGGGAPCWYRSCRCGNSRGFLFTEEDLEEASDLGELVVGCQDCSLWIRVHFSVVND